jgi:hypothetical protein
MKSSVWALTGFVTFFVITAVILVACGGGNSSRSSSTLGTVTLTMSDPPTCGTAAQGAFAHVYVTISDVRISTNANAGDNDSGWVDLTPNLSSAPQQVDLLATPANGCFLAQLGTAGIPAGTYQQIRLILANGGVQPANGNHCGSGLNCVVLSGSTSPIPLQLSSEAQTGLKIPAGQIAGGQFTIAAGETKDLNIDFDACASIVMTGNNGFRLKPVLHAGEVSTVNSTAITGRLVDQTGVAIDRGVIVLEQKDATSVDRAVLQTTPDANGNFSICPVPSGTYDLVAVGISSTTGNAYGPTLIASISPGTSLSNVTLNLTPASSAFALLKGMPMVSAQNTNGGVQEDFVVSALQQVTINSTPTRVTIPLAAPQQQSATLTLTTTAGGDCQPSTFCADGVLAVPAASVTVGTFSNGRISYGPAGSTPVTYTIDAQAPSTSTHFCSQPVLTTPDINSITPGFTFTLSTPTPLAFTACQ